MYEVIVRWHDLKDDNHQYHPGDTYPREGLKPNKKRILELSSSSNIRGIPLIKKTEKKVADDGEQENGN
ncbi:hypothetical protein [Erysipelothrix anatis]|uniref:hypothetical protein n=1 Tax=Erysipelothrix anatis TaxID=2683713 RepID=UPI0013582883|nr:hypothetical protein [Erysipelothrix anatis]